MLGLLQLLAIGFVLAVLLGAFAMLRRLRRPPRKTYAWAVSKGLPGDPGELPSPRAYASWRLTDPEHPGLEYPVWDIEGDDPQGPVVVFTPGWGDSRLGVLVRLPGIAPAASRIVAWDPPGQGEAPGRCDLGTREPRLVRALLEAVAGGVHDGGAEGTERGPDQGARAGRVPVVLYGTSLGAGASIVCAAEDGETLGIAGVIAEGVYRLPWTPAFNVMRLSGYPYRLNGPIVFALLGLRLGAGIRWRGTHGGIGFDRAAHAARLKCPLLLLHGSADEVCPIAEARGVLEAARAAGVEARLAEIEGGGHNDLWVEEGFARIAEEAVQGFIAKHKAHSTQHNDP